MAAAALADAWQASPATQLLLACLRWPVDPATCGMIRQAAEAVDWPDFLALARRHRVEALVDHALRTAGVSAPAAIAGAFGAQTQRSSFLELAYAGEAALLFGRLRGKGLHPLLLKGAATALLCYGRLGLKASRDLDLLVPEAEVEEALALLEEQGYAVHSGEAPRDPQWRRRHKDVVMTRPDSPIIIELHWRLFDNPALEPRRSGDDARTLSLYPGAEVETLGEEAFFAYLCLHGAQHAWSRLKWLAEFDALVSREASVEALYETARRRQAGLAAAQALLLRARLLGKPAPAAVEALYRSNRRLRWLVALALRSALEGGSIELEDRPLGSTPKNVSHYLLTGGVRYWINELGYDMRDDTAVQKGGVGHRFGTTGRLVNWLWRVPAALRERRNL